jgi:hypothetical protein
MLDRPTEPLDTAMARLAAAAPPGDPVSLPPSAADGPFVSTSYLFTTGLRAGEIASIRAEDGRILLSYRSFATVIGVVATLVSSIVAVAGIAAALFLLAEEEPLRAIAAFLLTTAFAFVILMLVPRSNVTLFDDGRPAITISQQTVFPRPRWVVATPDGGTLAVIARTHWSRLGRNRWQITRQGRYLAEAEEEGLVRALLRKFLGKFSRRFETDVVIHSGGIDAGRVVRRANHGPVDRLEIRGDVLDRRVAVALATLILGREP